MATVRRQPFSLFVVCSGNVMPRNAAFPRLTRQEIFLYRMKRVLIVGWVLLVTVPPSILWSVRGTWLTDLGRPTAQHEWDQFRQDMRQQSDRSGPVQHKVPKSTEPPVRVWLRDYFWLAVTAWSVLGSVLYAFLSMAVIGVLASVPSPAEGVTSQESTAP